MNVSFFEETLPNGKKYIAVYRKNGTMMNTDMFVVPQDHYFFMGDNRDCSKDSRFLASVGYVSFVNLVGKAKIIFFSNDKNIGNLFEFWKWNKSIRFKRFFKKIDEIDDLIAEGRDLNFILSKFSLENPNQITFAEFEKIIYFLKMKLLIVKIKKIQPHFTQKGLQQRKL